MPPLGRLLLLLLLAPALLVPLDFVSTSSWVRASVAVSVVTGWVVLAVLAAGRKHPWAVPVLGASCALLLTGVVSGTVVGTALTVGALTAGFSAGAVLRGRRLVPVFFVVGVVVLVLEAVAQRHLYLQLLGTPLFEYFPGVDFRSRGLQGHPVPAAFGVAALAPSMWARPPGGAPALPRAVVLVGVLAALATTGTRSVLVVGGLMLLLAVRRRHLPVAVVVGVTALWGAAVLTLLVLLPGTSTLLPRALDFASVTGSESFTVRASGPEVVATLGDRCGLPCVVVGNGNRALEAAVPTVRAAAGPATVDNQYLTAYYDHGLVALGLLLLLLWLARRTARDASAGSAGRAAALGVVCLMLGGLFFDGVHVRSTMFLLGLLTAWMSAVPVPSAGDDELDDGRPDRVRVPRDLRDAGGSPPPVRRRRAGGRCPAG